MSRQVFLIIAACFIATMAYVAYGIGREDLTAASDGYSQIDDVQDGNKVIDSSADAEPQNQSQIDAIQAARDYQPPSSQACLAVITPAIHVDSGAELTFGGCLPPGWAAR